MNKFWKIAGIATLVAVIGAGVLGGVVLAQEPPITPFGRMADYLEQVRDLVASKLGVERAELDTATEEARQEVIEQAVEDGVITQEQADDMISRLEDGNFPGMRSFGHGKRGYFDGPMGGLIDHHGDEMLAEQLGMTTEELQAELQAGKTIAELAEEKGVDLQAAQIEAAKERIQQAVQDGTMTQEQADWMLEGLEQGFSPGIRGFMPGGRGGGRGGFRGFPGQTTP